MHIITGLILAGLAGMKKNKGKPSAPRFSTGPVQTAHHLPGRIRFRIPLLKGDTERKQLLEGKLPTLDGIESTVVDTRTGSMLIHYREPEIRPDLIFAAVVRLLGVEDEVARPPQPAMTREIRSFGESLNRAVYEKSGGLVDLWTLLVIALVGLGVRKLTAEGIKAFPTGFTLIWWALSALTRSH